MDIFFTSQIPMTSLNRCLYDVMLTWFWLLYDVMPVSLATSKKPLVTSSWPSFTCQVDLTSSALSWNWANFRVTFFFHRCSTLRGCRLKSSHGSIVKLCQNVHSGLPLWFTNFLGGKRPWKGPHFNVFCNMSTIAKTEKHPSLTQWIRQGPWPL